MKDLSICLFLLISFGFVGTVSAVEKTLQEQYEKLQKDINNLKKIIQEGQDLEQQISRNNALLNDPVEKQDAVLRLVYLETKSVPLNKFTLNLTIDSLGYDSAKETLDSVMLKLEAKLKELEKTIQELSNLTTALYQIQAS